MGRQYEIMVFDDEAVLFSTAGKRWWTLDNGVEIGMPIERVRELLGKEDYLSPDDPGNRAHIHRLVYEYDNGNAGFLYFTDSNENSESGVEANKVISITITSDVYYANIGSVYPHPTVNTDDSGK